MSVISLRAYRFVFFAVFLIFWGCAHHQTIPAEKVHTVYRAQGMKDSLLNQYAPIFLAYHHEKPYNRIGRPSVKLGGQEWKCIYVDHEKPVIYCMKKKFSGNRDNYTNLIYRIHFPKVPFSLIPFYLTAGKNVGLIVVITLDSRHRPVLVATVHTCGCYLSLTPTSFLPQDAYPKNWKKNPVCVYGEKLPWILDFSSHENPRLLVHLRPGVHRVMDLEIIEDPDTISSPSFSVIPTPLENTAALEKLDADGSTTSFYYQKGLLKGHVKGSVKPLESILLGIISLDLFVGSDKKFADTQKTGNPFYTSLKPWNREASNMWNFPGFLEFWGWDL
jgi:hypothetical protein